MYIQYMHYIGHLKQPIAFETWSEFKNECAKSGEMKSNPEKTILVKIGLKPTRLLNVDSDHNVRNNFFEYFAVLIINQLSH